MSEANEEKGFSWMAFFFAPYYYAGYGKFSKGLLYAIIGFIPLTSLIVNIYAGTKAKKELPIGKEDFKWFPAISMYIIHATIWFTVFLFSPMAERENKITTLENVSGVWLTETSNELIKVDFRNENKYLEINQINIPVQIANIDNENHIISFKINLNDNILIWTLQQIFDEKNKFHLNLISHDGKSDKLSFVRNIIDETDNKNNIKEVKQSNVTIIDKLYPEILTDYLGVSEEKLVQDFGKPFEKNDAGKERATVGLTVQNSWEYIYKFKQGTLTFYIDKTELKSIATYIELKPNSNIEILLPFQDLNFTLGKSPFNTIFNYYSKPDKLRTQDGNAYGTYFVELPYYCGRDCNFKTYIFGFHPLNYSIEDIERNYKIIKNEKPNYLIIKDGYP